MTQLIWDLDNLTVGQQVPADPKLRTPAGVVTAVEHRACDDHDPAGDSAGWVAGWVRHCYYCKVAWAIAYEGLPEVRRVSLQNEYLWTPADKLAVVAWPTVTTRSPWTADQ
jgi:hypothetical protein